MLSPHAVLRRIAGFALLLSPVSSFAQSEYQGTYIGYAYIRMEGAVTQPETPTGIAIAEIDINGNISVQDGEATGTINSGGTITWNQPNGLFLTAGNVASGVLHATGSTSSDFVTTHTRLELRTGGGNQTADHLDDHFRLINPENSLQNKIRVIHDGTQFVVLGANGVISTSDDGLSWQSRSMGTVPVLKDFAYGNGTYIAVGESNTILTSTDLQTWVPRFSGIGEVVNWPIQSVAYYNGRFYIVNTIGTVARSSNSTASTWEAPLIAGNASTGLGATARLCTLGDRLYLSGKRLYSQGAEIHYSLDGATFTQGSFSGSGGNIFTIDGITGGNGLSVLHLSNGQVAISSDGVTFNRVTTPEIFAFVGFDGERFVGRTAGSANTKFLHSTNATTWTTGTVQSLVSVVDLVAHNGIRVGVGADGKYSTDGLEWRNISTPTVASDFIGPNATVRAVYGNGLYILHGKAQNYITQNGIDWAAVPGKSPIVFGNGVFLSGNQISTDGVNWTTVAPGFSGSESASQTAFDGSVFLIISSAGNAYTSANGISWQKVHSSGNAPVNGHTVVGSNGKWFSLATGGSYSRSLDGGVTWSNQQLGNSTLNGIAFGNGRWIIGAQDNRFYSSLDGAAFSQAHPNLSSSSGAFTSVSFIDGQFYLFYEGPNLYFVGNGTSDSWQQKGYAHATRITSTAIGPEFALMVGLNHHIIRIDRHSVGHPVITSHPPASLTMDQDQTLELEATAFGSGTLVYQWYRNGLPLVNGGRVSGADASTLSLSSLRGSDAGHYSLVVSNEYGSAVTKTSSLEVRLKPLILSQPESLAQLPNTNASFTVVASADTTSIQWLFNGNPIPGATSATLSLTNVSPADAGLYQVVLTNTIGSITSAPASLSIQAFAQGFLLDAAFSGNLPAFSPTFSNSSGMVARKILPLPNGQFYVAGQFAYHNGTEETYNLVRLNADGSLDPTFVMPKLTFVVASNARPVSILDAAVDSTGRVTATFTSAATAINGVPVQNVAPGYPTSIKVARFATNGNLDLPYVSGAVLPDNVRAVAIDSQDRILLGGFNLFGTNASTRKHLVRLTTTGAHDTSFIALHNQISVTQIQERGIAVGPDDSVFVAGSNVLSTITEFPIRKLTSSGTLAPGFTSPVFTADFAINSYPRTILANSDGSLVVVGGFSGASGSPSPGIARFAANGARITANDALGVFSSYYHQTVLPLSGDGLFIGGQHVLAGFDPPVHNLTQLGGDGQAVLNAGIALLTSPTSPSVEDLAHTSGQTAILAGHGFGLSSVIEGYTLVSRISISTGALPGAPALGIISLSPDTFAEPGDPVHLTVAVVGANLSFQWLKNGSPIQNETASSLSFAAVTPNDGAEYRVRVSDVSGSITSGPIILTVPGATTDSPSFAAWADHFDLPLDQRDFDHDPAGDGVANGFKFLLGLSPTIPTTLQLEVPPPSGSPRRSGADVIASNLTAGLSSPGIEAGKTYQIVSFRLPADMKGLSHDVQPTTTLNYSQPTAEAHPFGQPVPDDDYIIHSYYLLPAVEDTSELFWRLSISQ